MSRRNKPVRLASLGGIEIASDVKTLGIGALLLAGTVTGIYILLKKEIKATEKSVSEAKGLQPGTAQSYATRLEIALDNGWKWWADNGELLKILKEIPTRSLVREVEIEFKKQTDKYLLTELRKTFSSKEFAQYEAYYRIKPEAPKR